MPGPCRRGRPQSQTPRAAARVFALAAALAPVGFCGPPSSAPATAQATATRFSDGVLIDWPARTLLVEGHVVLREGPLEFLACFAGKEHESIVRLHATGTNIYMALGLLGVSPGHPPRWSDDLRRFTPPEGELIDIAFEWDAGRQRADAFSWLREVEYDRNPLPRPWVFAGSKRTDRETTLLCDRSGAGVALVDFADSLICLTRSHASRDEELWAQADSVAIPPLKTPVTMLLRPASPARYEITVDFRGAAFVNGRFAAVADLLDLLQLQRKLDPHRTPEIRFNGGLRSDQAELLALLRAAGVKAEPREGERREGR